MLSSVGRGAGLYCIEVGIGKVGNARQENWLEMVSG